MPPTPKKPRQWLLTVASASALLPGCAQEHDSGGDDSPGQQESPDQRPIGSVLIPDGGQPVPDQGPVLGMVVNPHPPGLVMSPPDAGIMASPDDGGSVPAPGIVALPPVDAGVPDAAGSDAGAKDAGCKIPVLINGIVVAPPDASCTPIYPGIMPRNVDGD
ncbi:MAG TPA: hypothetical protein VFZ61_08615 [Polyangiales bacterium]